MTHVTSPVQVGQAVPDFTLETYLPAKRDFGTFSLAEAKKSGKWTVLFFYPADFTFVCATEFAALAEHYKAFQAAGAEVITVSTDTKFTHLAWRDHEGELAKVEYPMGADRTGAVSKLFGVYIEANGLALRGSFVIDPKGVLQSSEVNFLNVGRNVEELLRKLRASVHCSTHGDEVCPAKWTKTGDVTLKNPGAAMVGKVHEALKR
jgi:peroxiredoxin (alkyl hydroperoxide reductase subunit C)